MPCDRTEDFLVFAARAKSGVYNGTTTAAGRRGQPLTGDTLRNFESTRQYDNSTSTASSSASDNIPYDVQQNDIFRERHENLRSRLHVGENSFNAAAAEFDELLQRTHAKLQELARLARQRSIYSDRTAQIQELTYDVKRLQMQMIQTAVKQIGVRAITTLNGKIETLERKAQETCSNSSSSQAWQHCTTLIDMLKCRLLDLTKKFKDVLLLRTEKIKIPTKQKDVGMGVMCCSGEQQRLTMQRGHASAYAQSRAEAVENVQRVLGELATIFQRVATMISHQDEMIQRIDQNIGTSLHNVRQGQTELLNYFQRISSNRTLIVKVFAILFAFIIFFVFFLS